MKVGFIVEDGCTEDGHAAGARARVEKGYDGARIRISTALTEAWLLGGVAKSKEGPS